MWISASGQDMQDGKLDLHPQIVYLCGISTSKLPAAKLYVLPSMPTFPGTDDYCQAQIKFYVSSILLAAMRTHETKQADRVGDLIA